MSRTIYDYASGEECTVGDDSGTKLVVRRASDIEPERIEFLWPGRLARGKHTAFAGDPGDGKSQVSISIAAKVSTGGEWPCDEGRAPVGDVIILSAEDGAADTIVPRLIAARADTERVHIVSAVGNDAGAKRAFNLQADLALLEEKIAEIGNVALVIIDPISSYLGRTDSHKNAEVRSVLEPLSEMAERNRVAVLSITHFSKAAPGNGARAMHRFIGSIAFTGAPRAAFAVVRDKDEEDRMLLLCAKNNMAPHPDGLAYRVNETILPEPHQPIVTSRVVWDATPVAISADEAMTVDDEKRSALSEAEDFLRAVLADGPVPSETVKEAAKSAGISVSTLKRAKKRIGVESDRDSYDTEGNGVWSYVLPNVQPNSARDSSEPQDAHVLNMSPLRVFEPLADAD